MTSRSIKIAVLAGIALLAATAAAVAIVVNLVVRAREETEPRATTVAVPATWRDVRDSFGHAGHLERGIRCVECHTIEGGTFAAPAADACARCHQERIEPLHLTGAFEGSPACGDCHPFKIQAELRPWACMRCHSEPRETAEQVTAHASLNCDLCHAPHGGRSVDAARCLTCHPKSAVEHGDRIPTDTATCIECHSGHRVASEASDACAGCHLPSGREPELGSLEREAEVHLVSATPQRGQRQRRRSEQTPAGVARTPPQVSPSAIVPGHDRCVSCHQPHQVKTGGIRACASCHAALPVLASAQAKEHRDCSSCHAPHEVRSPASCESCHKTLSVAHGTGQAAQCTSCHPAHPEQRNLIAHDCSRCHEAARTDTSFHSGVQCERCHQAHEFAREPACDTCHGAIAARAATNQGHAVCAECHAQAPHRPDLPTPACASCHAPQHETAPEGHQACSKCHEAHAGDVRANATCASCHAAQNAGAHGGTQPGCDKCHRPHGPGGVAEPPACSSCHARGSLPSLHTVAEHDRCASCHSPHERQARADRATCTSSCHQAQVNHEPQARSCKGCHAFR